VLSGRVAALSIDDGLLGVVKHEYRSIGRESSVIVQAKRLN
jgi:hypothetical protein